MRTQATLTALMLVFTTVACGDDGGGAETDEASSTSPTTDGGTTTSATSSTGAEASTGVDPGTESDSDSASTGEPPAEATNAEKAVALIEAFESGDPAALDFVADTYVQHNLAFPDGKDVLAGLLAGEPTGFETETIRVFEDGDVVFMHNTFGGAWNGGVPQVTFDVFRFDDAGLIAEHWDNLADIEDDMDGTTQIDGPTEATGLEDTEANRTLITDMLQTLFVDGQWSQIDTYFDLENYVQHSVGFGADSSGLQMVLGSLADGTPFYASVEYVYVMGDMALTLSEGFPDEDTGLSDAYYDLFRIENGLVAEHWDVIQTIPAEEDWANTNGKW